MEKKEEGGEKSMKMEGGQQEGWLLAMERRERGTKKRKMKNEGREDSNNGCWL